MGRRARFGEGECLAFWRPLKRRRGPASSSERRASAPWSRSRNGWCPPSPPSRVQGADAGRRPCGGTGRLALGRSRRTRIWRKQNRGERENPGIVPRVFMPCICRAGLKAVLFILEVERYSPNSRYQSGTLSACFNPALDVSSIPLDNVTSCESTREMSHVRPSEHGTFPKKQVLLILGIRTEEPIGGVDNSYAFVLVFGLVRAGKQDLRVGVPYR